MLRISSIWKILSLCLLAHASLASAQQGTSNTAPPKLERLEEGSEPAVAPPPAKKGPKITEKKEGGRVTEAKVQAGGSSYTMKPNTPAGNAQPGDATSSNVRAPQWNVLEFDLNKKKKTGATDTPAAADAPAPPPPAAK